MLSFVGYLFPSNDLGKSQMASIFRAAIFHMGAHVLSSNFKDYEEWREDKEPRLANFIVSLLEDIVANAYVYAWYPDKLVDLTLKKNAQYKLHIDPPPPNSWQPF